MRFPLSSMVLIGVTSKSYITVQFEEAELMFRKRFETLDIFWRNDDGVGPCTLHEKDTILELCATR